MPFGLAPWWVAAQRGAPSTRGPSSVVCGAGSCWKLTVGFDLQEVNEGVQALSNSEEEKKGVAAALLAPLVPDVVKEEEERWRRKVICKEEVEPPPEEEVKAEEAPAAPEEPEPSRDPLEDTLQEELCSVVQSGESAEEEEEQDTLELEMVLERKKVRSKGLSWECGLFPMAAPQAEADVPVCPPQAELRALEEGDGSVSGSSPLSDGSQSASQDPARRLASKRGKWKLFVGAASPESASRGSSKTGRESPEPGEAGNGKGSLGSQGLDGLQLSPKGGVLDALWHVEEPGWAPPGSGLHPIKEHGWRMPKSGASVRKVERRVPVLSALSWRQNLTVRKTQFM